MVRSAEYPEKFGLTHRQHREVAAELRRMYYSTAHISRALEANYTRTSEAVRLANAAHKAISELTYLLDVVHGREGHPSFSIDQADGSGSGPCPYTDGSFQSWSPLSWPSGLRNEVDPAVEEWDVVRYEPNYYDACTRFFGRGGDV